MPCSTDVPESILLCMQKLALILKHSGMIKHALSFSFCLCHLFSMAQCNILHYSVETWNGVPPVVSPVAGKIILNKDTRSIEIHSPYRNETYKIRRDIVEEDSLAVYSCETRFPNGKYIRYVVKYDASQRILVLYPRNPYLKASTTFRLDPL